MTIKCEDFDFNNNLIDRKSYENILIYAVSYKILIGLKTSLIRFNQIDRFSRIYGGTRYLTLFESGKGFFLSQKSGIKDVFTHYYGKIKVDSYDFLSKEKILTWHNVIILIKSVLLL